MAVRHFTYDELCRRLQPYGCRRLNTYRSGLELWETGWGEPFSLKSDDGTYDEWLYFELVGGLIARTIPRDWVNQNGGK